jgi:divinyl protochlorophyllide a 8-vinyl-reductase
MTAHATDHAAAHLPPPAVATAGLVRAVVGPNAVTRVAEALDAAHGRPVTAAVFRAAGLTRHLLTPPGEMVDEFDVSALHLALHEVLGEAGAEAIATVAGRLTGDYLLANRIPRTAQKLLRWLPMPLAAGLLARAIARHAWTFTGSGRFAWHRHGPRSLHLVVDGSPVCRMVRTDAPACHYFAATFERVFCGALGRPVAVREIRCAATGDGACEFALTW